MVRMIQAFFEDEATIGVGFISPRPSDSELRRIAATVFSFSIYLTFSQLIIVVLSVERLSTSLLLIPNN